MFETRAMQYCRNSTFLLVDNLSLISSFHVSTEFARVVPKQRPRSHTWAPPNMAKNKIKNNYLSAIWNTIDSDSIKIQMLQVHCDLDERGKWLHSIQFFTIIAIMMPREFWVKFAVWTQEKHCKTARLAVFPIPESLVSVLATSMKKKTAYYSWAFLGTCIFSSIQRPCHLSTY